MECRFCLTKSPTNHIFELNLRIFHIIEEMLEINKDDDLPKLICNTCVTKLKTMEKFISQCEESDTYFRKNITLPIKQEPELLPLTYDNIIETYCQDTTLKNAQVEIQFVDCNKKSQEQNCNENEIKFKVENPDYSDILLDDNTSNDGQHDEEDNIAEQTTNDEIENKKLCENVSMLKRSYKPRDGVYTYACSLCPAKYISKFVFDFHVKAHSSKKIYKCNFCSIIFGSKVSRHYHRKRYHEYELIKSKLRFINDRVIGEEGATVIENNQPNENVTKIAFSQFSYECSLCPAKYNNKHNFDWHVKAHSSSKQYTCKFCSIIFGTIVSLCQHRRRYHKDEVCKQKRKKGERSGDSRSVKQIKGEELLDEEDNIMRDIINDVQTNGNSYTCPRCPAKYRNKKMLDWHAEVHNCKVTFTCQFCQVVCRTKSHLYTHMGCHKEEVMKLKLEKKALVEIRTKRAVELRSERAIAKQAFRCTLCPTVCRGKKEFDFHLKVHESKKSHTCQYCQRVFNADYSLSKHITSFHPHVRLMRNQGLVPGPHLCPTCGRVFKKLYNFRDHLETHNTECMYKCDICSKSYKTKQSITLHITQKHSNLPPSTCNYCPKTFSTVYLRNSHERVTHLKIPPTIPCNVCNKMFHTNSGLKRHIKIHADV